MITKLLYLFTRTPLHVGAGASVGAIDQPIQRERHTGFPIIPASSLKGSFADQWPVTLRNQKNELVRITSKKEGDKHVFDQIDESGAAWLFGSDDANVSFAGSLIFSEARILAFPIRSARGSYAWITSPLALQRAARDRVFSPSEKDTDDLKKAKEEAITQIKQFESAANEPKDNQAIFKIGNDSKLALPGDKIVLEEYCFDHTGTYPTELAETLAALIPDDALFQSITDRLVILSNGLFSHFVTTACEVAQHVRISDETGTAEGAGLFNQENVPADTLFYSVLSATNSRVPNGGFKYTPKEDDQPAKNDATAALKAFADKIDKVKVFQFGGDASTGLGFTTVTTQDLQA